MKKIFIFSFLIFVFLFAFTAKNIAYAADACTVTVNPASLFDDRDLWIHTDYPNIEPASGHNITVRPVNDNGNLGDAVYNECGKVLNVTGDHEIPESFSAGKYVVEIKTGCSPWDTGNACDTDPFTIQHYIAPTPSGPPVPENSYSCAKRSPECSDLNKYPNSLCITSDFSIASECQPPNCAMQNTSGNDSTQWTKSCAYSKVQPPPAECFHEGYKFCSNDRGGGDTCCKSENLVCQAQGNSSIAMGNGICVKAPPSLGQTCNTCLPGDKWDTAKKSCVDSNGNSSIPVSSIYCTITISTCVQGQGCIEMVNTNNGDPAAPPCASRTSDGKCLYVNTGFNMSIGTDPQSLIQTLFGLILSISGGIALLLIIISGYRVLASQGNPEALKGAREQLTAAIVGLLFIIFALVILQIIGFDILHIPGFGSSPSGGGGGGGGDLPR